MATVDVPEDRAKMNPIWRMGENHAEDMSAVIAFLKQQADVPVWAVGTSMGSFSAANIGIRLKDKIDGVVLTSSPTNIQKEWDLSRGYPNGVINMYLDRVTVPALIISHEDDACPRSPPSDISKLANKFSSSRKVEKIVFSGGDSPISGPCDSLAPHGYLGIESQVVDAIARFIVSN